MEPNHLTATAGPQEVVAKIDQKALRLSALLREIDNHPIELETVLRDQLDDVLEMLACRIAATRTLAAPIQPRIDGGRITRITGVVRRLGTATAVEAAVAVLIIIAAIVVRFWALQSQPGGLYPDEAAEGISAQNLLTIPGYHPVFFNSDGGREALYAYIVAAVFKFFGSSVLTLRGTAAAVGVAGVIATYVAVRRFGRARGAHGDGLDGRIALDDRGLARRIPEHPHRAGRRRRAGGAAALGRPALTRKRRHRRRCRGPRLLDLSTAEAAAVARDPLAASGCGRATASDSGPADPTLLWAGVAFAVVVAPMVYTAITDFSAYFGRAAFVSVFNSGSMSMDSYPVHILKTLGMFLFTGDPNARHDVSALPLLGPVLVVPFLLGIWHCWRRRDDHGYALVLLGLPVFLLPPLLANEGGAPHFLRSLGLEPYVAACIGLGCVEGVALLDRLAPRISWPERSVTRNAWTVCAIAVTAPGHRLRGDISPASGGRSLRGLHLRRRRPGECGGEQRDRRRAVDARDPRQL